MRIGQGYDVHCLVTGRDLVLGGVTIPFEKGLEGHSDADVLCHAIGDALLGAAGLGDMGRHFPDSDLQYRDYDSLRFLTDIADKVCATGLKISNIDATVICQRPRLADHLPGMYEKISQALQIDPQCLNIKATTEEGLGFTGREEGIAATAIALLG